MNKSKDVDGQRIHDPPSDISFTTGIDGWIPSEERRKRPFSECRVESHYNQKQHTSLISRENHSSLNISPNGESSSPSPAAAQSLDMTWWVSDQVSETSPLVQSHGQQRRSCDIDQSEREEQNDVAWVRSSWTNGILENSADTESWMDNFFLGGEETNDDETLNFTPSQQAPTSNIPLQNDDPACIEQLAGKAPLIPPGPLHNCGQERLLPKKSAAREFPFEAHEGMIGHLDDKPLINELKGKKRPM